MITSRKKAKLGVVIKDDKGFAADPIIGTYQIKLDDMIELMVKGQEWYNLAGAKAGKVKMLLQWKPVALSDALTGSGGYVTPIGVMRLHFRSAKELKNVETMGKSDPYVRVMLSGVQKGRTVTFQNNLNPDFDEVIYVPVHTKREHLLIEVMDEQDIGKDRSLGSLDVATADYVFLNEQTGEYQSHDTKTVQSALLRLGPNSPPKGVLNFTASFFPTVNVIDPEDEERDATKASVENGEKSIDPSGVSLESPARASIEPGRTRSGTVGTMNTLHSRNTSANGSVNLQKTLSANEKKQDDALPPIVEPPRVRVTREDLGNYGMSNVVDVRGFTY